MEKPHYKVRIRREYKVQYPNPIRVAAGERVVVGEEDQGFPGWRWCKAHDGREGWVPVELLSGEGEKAIMLENVPGLIDDLRLAVLKVKLRELGYRCKAKVLNAARFGVPQRRDRMPVRLGPRPQLYLRRNRSRYCRLKT